MDQKTWRNGLNLPNGLPYGRPYGLPKRWQKVVSTATFRLTFAAILLEMEMEMEMQLQFQMKMGKKIFKGDDSIKNSYMVYTDGACEPNPGFGGYCALIFRTGDMTPEAIITGGEKKTTNNRMEIMAVLSSFNYIKEKSQVTFYSDSQYVCNSINKWLYGWKARGLVMKNMDLWDAIWEQKQKHTIKAVWVKGHSGNFFNELADSMSIGAVSRVKRMRKKSFEEIK